MKNKYLPIILAFTLLLASCGEQLEEDNLRGKKDAQEKAYLEFVLPTVIKDAMLFYQNNGFASLVMTAASFHINSVGGGTENALIDFYTARSEWNTIYAQLRMVYSGIDLAKTNQSKAYEGIFTIYKALLFGMAVDFYGPAIYSEAIKSREGIIYPKYDKEEDVYNSILQDLKNANTLLKETTTGVDEKADLLYGGDLVKWRKFANSLRLRYLMRLSSKKKDMATSGINEIINSVSEYPLMNDIADNAGLSYMGITGENSWAGGPLVTNASSFQTKRPTRMLVDSLLKYEDPRMKVLFAPTERPWTSDPAKDNVEESVTLNGFTYAIKWEYFDPNATPNRQYFRNYGMWVGITPGVNEANMLKQDNANSDNSSTNKNVKLCMFSNTIRANSGPLLKAVVMNSDEVQFILAEAALTGIISSQSVDEYYNKAIELSLKRWGVTEADLITQFQNKVALKGDVSFDKQRIATQKWIALLFVSNEAFVDMRRTKLPDYSSFISRGLPLRFIYPDSERGQNRENYLEAIKSLSDGKDSEFSKVWLLQ